MLKLREGRLALCLFLLTCLTLSCGFLKTAQANDSPDWLNSPLYLNKIADDIDITTIPPTFFDGGNTDCTFAHANKCSVSTLYGEVADSSLWAGRQYRPIADYGGHRSNFIAIPNSDTALTFFGSPAFGTYLGYTNDISKSLIPKYITPAGSSISGIDNRLLDYFQLNHPPDGKIADRAGNWLPVELNSAGFSVDGEWMIITSPNRSTLRVNMYTGAVLPFGKVFGYGYGQNPTPKNTITGDGRYAAVAAQDTSAFAVYDLDSCGIVPIDISGPVNCQGRELLNSNFIGSQIPGFSGVRYMRFIDDDDLLFDASYKINGTTKYAQYTLSVNPGPVSKLQYLALGDSYISGEGAFDYRGGTDTDTNRCHISLLAYPQLIGRDLSYDSYNSVACSGATTNDIKNTSLQYVGQFDQAEKTSRIILDKTGLTLQYLSTFTPGHLDQLEFVKQYRPQAVTVSIGGNDMGFSKILQNCVQSTGTCYNTYEDRLELVGLINNTVFPDLVQTYKQIKTAAPADTRVYAIGYPQIAKPGGDCDANVHLNSDELVFGEQLIAYLDSVIQQAAAKAGVFYVDTQAALDGHRLCEAGPGDVAMNGLTAGNDRPTRFGGPIGDESYHPNALGYRLLEIAILSATDNLQAPMPAANSNAVPPSEAGLEILNAPKSSRTVRDTEYAPSVTSDIVYRNVPANFSINSQANRLMPDSPVQAELHSTPTSLGSFTADANGSLSGQVTIPANVPAGYHSLHFFGIDVSGQAVDIYKYVYVAASPDDLDGDGTPDRNQKCVGFEPASQDYDQDGVDDACDGTIDQPPDAAQTTTTSIAKSTPLAILASNPAKPAAGGSTQNSSNDDNQSSKTAVLGVHTAKPAPAATTNSPDSTKNSLIKVFAGASLAAIALAYTAKRCLF